MVDLYAKFKCYKCDETYLGRDIIKGSSIGSGFFTEYMCEDCTKENYIWATGDDLVTEHHKANIREMNKKVNKQINKIIYELSGILGGKEE
jgi:DNA-directed RNA polymerase subunit RPC12/RpoP